jgi:hypothetical protein
MKLICALLLAMLMAPAFAQSLEVGDEAADIFPNNWINPPTWGTLDELRGDVVLIKSWGIS